MMSANEVHGRICSEMGLQKWVEGFTRPHTTDDLQESRTDAQILLLVSTLRAMIPVYNAAVAETKAETDTDLGSALPRARQARRDAVGIAGWEKWEE